MLDWTHGSTNRTRLEEPRSWGGHAFFPLRVGNRIGGGSMSLRAGPLLPNNFRDLRHQARL